MRRGALTLCLTAALACVGAPPGGERGEDVDADGLERIPSRRVAVAYLRPDASFAGYSKVRVGFAGLAYREPPSEAPSGAGGVGGNYALTPKQRAQLERDFVAIFERELVESGLFHAASVPGPEVLDVRGRIVDLVVEVPPDPPPTEHVYVSRAGELTLLLEVVDSRSGEALLRLADRRVLSIAGTQLYRSGLVSHTAVLRRELGRWARVLRDQLSELRGEDTPPAA